MRSPRWQKTWGDARTHGARTALVILAIAIGITGAGAVLDTWALLRRVTVDGFMATHPPAATIRVDSVTPALMAAMRALPDVQAARARRTVSARIQSGGEWRPALLFVAPDLAEHEVGRVERVSGQWPPADSALVIEHSSVQFAGVSDGAAVRVQVGNGPVLSLPVTGTARDGSLPPGWMDHVVYAFVRPSVLPALGLEPVLTDVRLAVTGDATDRERNRRVAAGAAHAAQALGLVVREVEVPIPGRHEHAAQMDSLLFTQGAFAILLLLLGAFLVVNLVSAMLAGQQREIAVMKAIGASEAQLAQLYLVMALAFGLVANAIAIPAAAVLGRAYAEFAASLLNFEVGATPVPAWAFAVQVAVGLTLPLAAAWIPVRRGCAVSVATALRGAGPASVGASHVGRGGASAPRPWLLPVRNLQRAPVRAGLTLATLALGGAVFLGAVNLRASIVASVDHLFGDVLRNDLSLRFDAPVDPARMRAIATSVSGIASAEARGTARATVIGEEALPHGTLPVTAMPAASPLNGYTVLAGRWLDDADSTGVVVSRTVVADDSSFAVGRTIRLAIGGVERTWLVRGIVDGGPWPGAWMSLASLARATGDARTAVLAARATSREASEPLLLVGRLRDAFEAAGIPVASSTVVQASRGALEDHLLMVASFLGVVSQLMLIVGGLGLASTMSLGVLERTREIGVLKAIGASHARIGFMIQAEGLAMSLAGWALALPLSLPMSVILARAFGRVMFEVPVTWVPAWSGVLVWLALAVVVSVAACGWPARRAMRMSAVSALAWE